MSLNKALFILLAISLGLGEFQRLPGLPVYVHDLILALILVINRRQLKLWRPIIWFGLAGLISLIWAAGRMPLAAVLTGSLYLVRFLVYSLLIGLKFPVKYLIITSSMIAGLGLLQYLVIPDTRFLLSLNWDEHYFRLISTLFDPNFTGIILVLGLVLTYFYWPNNWRLYLLHLTALVLTYSRSSYLALLAAAGVTALIQKRYKLILITILLFALTLPFLPRPGGEGVKLERTASINQRLSNYGLGVELWRQSPVFGLGFNTLRYFRDNQLSHSASGLDSSLLLVLTTTGVVGLAAYLNLLVKLWQNSPAVVRVSLAALLVHSLFINSLWYSFVLIWLFGLVDKNKN